LGTENLNLGIALGLAAGLLEQLPELDHPILIFGMQAGETALNRIRGQDSQPVRGERAYGQANKEEQWHSRILSTWRSSNNG
jgi:hypothetical protein